jgi:hypothetical protein
MLHALINISPGLHQSSNTSTSGYVDAILDKIQDVVGASGGVLYKIGIPVLGLGMLELEWNELLGCAGDDTRVDDGEDARGDMAGMWKNEKIHDLEEWKTYRIGRIL